MYVSPPCSHPHQTVHGEEGRHQAYTEFHTMGMLYNAAPELVTRPIASGAYADMPDMHFILYEFFGFEHKVYPQLSCELYNFPRLVADFHKSTRWPGHKFGLELPVFGGNRHAQFPMTDSWARTFAEGIRGVWETEMEVQGHDDELAFLEEMMLEKVIPRLLKPLQVDGRELVPSLVHGDLWEGNTGVDPKTGMPKIFDATPMWAPAECEFWGERKRGTNAMLTAAAAAVL
jgi:fructosamine-3-kinase